jgi:hypothetical protein
VTVSPSGATRPVQLADELQGEHRHQGVTFRALGVAQKNRPQLQLPCFHRAEVAFDIRQVQVARMHRARVRDGRRQIRFQYIAAIEERELRLDGWILEQRVFTKGRCGR